MDGHMNVKKKKLKLITELLLYQTARFENKKRSFSNN